METPHFYNFKPYKTHFQDLIELERKEEISRHMGEIKQMTPQKREKAGRAILELSGRDAGKGLGGTHLIKFVRNGGLPKNELAVGDLVIISTGNPDGQEPQGTITEKTNFSITVAFNNKPPSYVYKKNLRLDLFANDISYQRMLEALKALKKNNVLQNLLTERLQPNQANDHTAEWINTELNESQKTAVKASLQSRDCFLIHGPPGTGKTTTLVETIIQHARSGDRLLATADSNTAVDNLVEKLNAQGCKVIRLGNPARINLDLVNHSLDYLLQFEADFKEAKSLWERIDELKEKQKNHQPATGQSRRGLRDSQIKRLAEEDKTSRGIPPGKMKAMAKWLKIQDEISEMADQALALENQATNRLLTETEVICATNATAGSNILEGYQFETICIDEATQSIEPACLIPMVKGKKFIMAGDHKQLPPTVLNQQAQPYLQFSLFERLMAIYGQSIKAMLTVQYRMHQAIMSFPNHKFYEGSLQAHETVAEHTLADLPIASSGAAENYDWQEKSIAANPVNIFLNTGHHHFEEQVAKSFSYRNKKEAEIVKDVAEKLLNCGIEPQQIGIISPYTDQVELIKTWMDNPDRLEIKTVDGFQGREKEVIILSFVRSNEDNRIGFLTDYRRLNVAITRARRKLIMTGDATQLNENEVYQELLSEVEKISIT